MTHEICDECETVAYCSKVGCIPKVMGEFVEMTSPFNIKKSKLNADYYISRILKSESPAELLKNQADLVLFLNRRFGYETEQYIAKYKDILKKFEPKPSEPEEPYIPEL